jgi:hypothetical protein
MSRPDENPNAKAVPGEQHLKASRWDIARWVGAAAVAVVAALFYFHAVDHQSICHQQLAREGATAVVQVCGPPRLLDLAPFALLIAVLLWPDLGELAVAGLFTLRRRVAAQEQRQQVTENRLLQVDQQLTQLAVLSQTQTAIGAVNHYYAADQEELKRNIEAKEAKEAKGADQKAGADQKEGGAVDKRRSRPEVDQEEGPKLLGEFLREYAELEPYLLPAGGRPRAEFEDLDPDRRSLIEDWRGMFKSEIAALRQTRNAIVHRPDSISPDTLRGAIANTRELSRILLDRIG